MDSPSASLFPPLALTYIPCCYSPSSFLRPVLLPLMPLAPAPVDVPGPAAHHQQHHHSCLRCRLQLPAAVPVPRPSSSPAPPHRCCLQPTQQLSTPYATNITTLCVTNFLLCSPSLYFNSNRIIIIMASYIKGSEYQMPDDQGSLR